MRAASQVSSTPSTVTGPGSGLSSDREICLSRIGLVTTAGEVVQDLLGRGGDLLAAEGDRGGLQRP